MSGLFLLLNYVTPCIIIMHPKPWKLQLFLMKDDLNTPLIICVALRRGAPKNEEPSLRCEKQIKLALCVFENKSVQDSQYSFNPAPT